MEPTCSSRELHAPTCAILDDEKLEPPSDMSLALNAASMLNVASMLNAASMLEHDSEPINKARRSSIRDLFGLNKSFTL